MENAVTTNPAVERALDVFGEVMRSVHFRQSRQTSPWLDLNLTLPQLRVLGVLACHPNGIPGRELASLLGVGPSAITPLLDRLVENGYARREEDRTDRRITRLLPTDEGLALLGRLIAGRRELLGEVLAALAPDEMETVTRAFHYLLDATRRLPGVAPATGKAPDREQQTTLPRFR